MRIVIDSLYRWNHRITGDKEQWYIGNDKPEGNFAIITKEDNRVTATVDKIRSYPIFYCQKKDELFISNSARMLKSECGLEKTDDLSLLEFQMAGYVTGGETLYKGLYQLQAGEKLSWSNGKWGLERYYTFYSDDIDCKTKDADLMWELEERTRTVFQQIIDEAKGRPVWVPLSGGLDSRLVLCKLHQLGYDNLTAFSYGPPRNYEAKAAKYVAGKVGVPWHFLPTLRKGAKKFFASRERERYWKFSDGLCSSPFHQDIQVFWENRMPCIPHDAIIINGNSGDFTTGGHVPDPSQFMFLGQIRTDQLAKAIINKHYSLWNHLKTPENRDRIEKKIFDLLHLEVFDRITPQEFAKLWELWEWQERQSKFVVNGQRNYDFYGYEWRLPHWHSLYLDFWDKIPLHLKQGQKLYKDYLNEYDFYKVFRNFPFKIWRWPGPMMAILPFAKAARIVRGQKGADWFYKLFWYYGHYRDSTACCSYWEYLKGRGSMRMNSNALLSRRWVQENLG